MAKNLEFIFNDEENHVIFFSEKTKDGYKGIYSFRYDTAQNQTCLFEYTKSSINSLNKSYIRKKILEYCYYPVCEVKK